MSIETLIYFDYLFIKGRTLANGQCKKLGAFLISDF
jgi:hypothetical protein